MDIKTTICIDLGEFGTQGFIEVARPTFRRITETKNELGKCTIKSMDGGKPEVQVRAGDIYLIQILAYVRSAPFDVSPEGFLEFCDKIDAERPGSAQDMVGKIEDAIIEVQRGHVSPFATSRQAEIEL